MTENSVQSRFRGYKICSESKSSTLIVVEKIYIYIIICARTKFFHQNRQNLIRYLTQTSVDDDFTNSNLKNLIRIRRILCDIFWRRASFLWNELGLQNFVETGEVFKIPKTQNSLSQIPSFHVEIRVESDFDQFEFLGAVICTERLLTLPTRSFDSLKNQIFLSSSQE